MNRFLIYALACLALAFTACSDDDDNTGGNGITPDGKVEVKASEISGITSSVNIAEVKLEMYSTNGIKETVASSKWENGFSVNLPEKLDSKYLAPVTDIYESDGTDGITYSNKSVKLSDTETRFKAYDAAGTELGIICIGKADYSVSSYYIYADGDCKITGKYTWNYTDDKGEDIYNLDFKEGWNLVYYSVSQTGDNFYTYNLTTTRPTGLGWVFGDEDDWEGDGDNTGGNGNGQNGTITLKASDISDLPTASEIAEVKLEMYSNDGIQEVIATTKWENGFTFELPATVASKYLFKLTEEVERAEEDIDDGDLYEMAISNRNTKVSDFGAEINLYTSGGDCLGRIYYGNADTDSFYRYADSDCTVQGYYIYFSENDEGVMDGFENKFIYDFNFIKGWNIQYFIVEKETNSETNIYTTSTPSDMKWMFTTSSHW